MHCISFAILSRLSQFPSPAVGKNWPVCVDVLLNNQSTINDQRTVDCQLYALQPTGPMIKTHEFANVCVSYYSMEVDVDEGVKRVERI